MPITLGQFAQQQIIAQGLTVKQFSKRAGLGLSHSYQILRGERPRASAETFDAVARGLNMTPAEMAVAMGKAAAHADPDESEILALFRQVSPDKRPAARDMLRGLAVQPVRPQANGRRDGAGKRHAGVLHQSEQHGEYPQGDEGNGPLTVPSRRAASLIASVVAFILGPFTFERPLTTATRQI